MMEAERAQLLKLITDTCPLRAHKMHEQQEED